MQLVRPAPEHLTGYVAALERGWSADNERGVEAAREELSRIHADAAAFLASMEDREAKGPPVTLPDGSTAKRVPGFRRWLWDGEFCGSIALWWQPGTTALDEANGPIAIQLQCGCHDTPPRFISVSLDPQK
jgi:predicted acetyltransferase